MTAGEAYRLTPTPTRVALLRQVRAGHILQPRPGGHSRDLAGHRVTAGIADLALAGWVERAPGCAVWDLTAAGRAVLDQAEVDRVITRHEATEAANELVVVTLLQLVRDLADSDPCQHDHHGHCQAHGWTATQPQCPHRRAQALLTPKVLAKLDAAEVDR